eukprot:g82511.t1
MLQVSIVCIPVCGPYANQVFDTICHNRIGPYTSTGRSSPPQTVSNFNDQRQKQHSLTTSTRANRLAQLEGARIYMCNVGLARPVSLDYNDSPVLPTSFSSSSSSSL